MSKEQNYYLYQLMVEHGLLDGVEVRVRIIDRGSQVQLIVAGNGTQTSVIV